MWRSADADVRDAEMERHEIENDITAEFSRLADDAKRLSEETGKEVKPQTFAKGPVSKSHASRPSNGRSRSTGLWQFWPR